MQKHRLLNEISKIKIVIPFENINNDTNGLRDYADTEMPCIHVMASLWSTARAF